MSRFLAAAILAALSLAIPVASLAASEDEARTAIARRFPGVTPADVQPTPIPGLYEVMAAGNVFYVSADGRYLVRGTVIDIEQDRNLTEPRRTEARARALAQLDDADLITFGGSALRHTVIVFTDVDCAYCRRLHSQVEEYNSRGIRIRYAAYPRNGMAHPTWEEMEQVWCAEDKQRALTLAKLDRPLEHERCVPGDAITRQWQLGRMLGVRGTPAIFTTAGEMIPGYLPPDQLLNRLEELSRK